jgi:beta-galactosidase GanA
VRRRPRAIAPLILALLVSSRVAAQRLPRLETAHGVTQLIVDDKPTLLRAGELENSSASSDQYMSAVWPKLAGMRFNAVLVPVYWELIEPNDGRFDFRSVDSAMASARRGGMRLVLLWFGSWKNSMSSYVPAWVKRNPDRFPRARQSDGKPIQILSAFSRENLNADSRAFAALMRHLRSTDDDRHTVVMVQVENEVGMIPEARDHSDAANRTFDAPVPAELTDYLTKHRDSLAPDLKAAWEQHGFKTGAAWAETFGATVWTDELFTAWTEGRYTNAVAANGKAEYPLPMFVNAALVRPGRQPGQYPSGGPLPHLFDVWKAASPSIDFLAPDLYFPNVVEWARKYARAGNPFFIPETGRVSAAEMSANALYAFGSLSAIGFSPYAPEFLSPDESKVIAQTYDIVDQLTPLILANQGSTRMVGIKTPRTFDGAEDLSAQRFTFDSYTFDVRFKQPPPISTGAKEETEIPGAHGGLIIQTGDDEFIVAGTGILMTFVSNERANPVAGIETVEEGRFERNVWTRGRVLNGDDTNQGRELRLPPGQFTIRRLRLYRYH